MKQKILDITSKNIELYGLKNLLWMIYPMILK